MIRAGVKSGQAPAQQIALAGVFVSGTLTKIRGANPTSPN